MSFMSIVAASAVIIAVLHSPDDVNENVSKLETNGKMKTIAPSGPSAIKDSKMDSFSSKPQKNKVQTLAFKEIKLQQAEETKVGDVGQIQPQSKIKRPMITKSIKSAGITGLWDKDSENSDEWIK